MNSIWNTNLQAFKTRFPGLFSLLKNNIELISLQEENSFPFWKISTSKTNVPTAQDSLTGLHLHSTYNPQREAQNLLLQAEKVSTAGVSDYQNNCQNSENQNPLAISKAAESSSFIFEGFGLGYLPMEAARRFPEKTFILIEPDPMHFLAALFYTDWTEIFKISSLIILVSCPPDQAINLITQNRLSESLFFKTKSQTVHDEKYFSFLDSLIQRNQEKEKINNATLERFGKLWIRNSIKNLKPSAVGGSIMPYKNQAAGKNIPFVLIAAGPTLETLLPYLSEVKKRAVLICVDTALQACLQKNVEPDFIILTDPQYWAWRHISNLKSPSSILITEAAVVPQVFRFNCKKILCCQSNFMFQQFFENFSIQKGKLTAGGSVASTAWDFARFCGGTEIYTAGLDLSFPEKKTHIKGSQFEQNIHKNSIKIKPAGTTSLPGLFAGNSCIEKNYDNEPVITDSKMKMFAWWFESRAEQYAEVKTFNLSSKGLKIPGISRAYIKDLLNKPEILNGREQFINLYKSEKNIPSEKDFEASLKRFTDCFSYIKSTAEKMCSEFSAAFKNQDQNSNFNLQKAEQDFKISMTQLNASEIVDVLKPTPAQLNLQLAKLDPQCRLLPDSRKLLLKKITEYSCLVSAITQVINLLQK